MTFLYKYLLGSLAIGGLITSCSANTQDASTQPGINPFEILTPDTTVVLENTDLNPVTLRWKRATSTSPSTIFYEVIFTQEENSNTPLYTSVSDKSGYGTSLELRQTEIDNIAKQAGLSSGESGDLYWYVKAVSGLTEYINPEVRKINVTRIDTSNPNTETAYWTEAADSLNFILVEQFLNKDKGIFWGSAKNALNNSDILYWQQAHYINVLVYAYERIRDSQEPQYQELAKEYERYFQLWLQNHANNWHTPNSFYNGYTDDMCWMVLTLLHMSEATKDERYYQEAKSLYDNDIITRASDNDGYGWALPWNDQNSVRNACTNNPACIGASLLYLKTGNKKYLEDAQKLYAYIVKRILTSDGKLETTPLSYTQGTFIEAARLLYHLTNDSKYLEKAKYVMDQTLHAGWCTKNGLLRNEGTSADQSIFKAIFVPYAVNFALDEAVDFKMRDDVRSFLLENARTLWQNNLNRKAWPKMYCHFYWGQTWSDEDEAQYKGSTGAHASGCSLLENVVRLTKNFQN